MRIASEDTLDEGWPRAYTPDLYQQKCAAMSPITDESTIKGAKATRDVDVLVETKKTGCSLSRHHGFKR